MKMKPTFLLVIIVALVGHSQSTDSVFRSLSIPYKLASMSIWWNGGQSDSMVVNHIQKMTYAGLKPGLCKILISGLGQPLFVFHRHSSS